MRLTLTSLVLLSLSYTYSQVIFPVNVTGNGAIVRFSWDSFVEPSYVDWQMEFWKGNRQMWSKELKYKPLSIYLNDLDEWTNYTVVLRGLRELHFHNVIYTCDVLLEHSKSFITIPRKLLISEVRKDFLRFKSHVHIVTQIYNPQDYKYTVEWKDVDSPDFDHKTDFKEISAFGSGGAVEMPTQWKAVLARVRVKSKASYPGIEEYYGPTHSINI